MKVIGQTFFRKNVGRHTLLTVLCFFVSPFYRERQGISFLLRNERRWPYFLLPVNDSLVWQCFDDLPDDIGTVERCHKVEAVCVGTEQTSQFHCDGNTNSGGLFP